MVKDAEYMKIVTEHSKAITPCAGYLLTHIENAARKGKSSILAHVSVSQKQALLEQGFTLVDAGSKSCVEISW